MSRREPPDDVLVRKVKEIITRGVDRAEAALDDASEAMLDALKEYRAAHAEIARLRRWLEVIEGGMFPEQDAAVLRQRAAHALAGSEPPR